MTTMGKKTYWLSWTSSVNKLKGIEKMWQISNAGNRSKVLKGDVKIPAACRLHEGKHILHLKKKLS